MHEEIPPPKWVCLLKADPWTPKEIEKKRNESNNPTRSDKDSSSGSTENKFAGY